MSVWKILNRVRRPGWLACLAFGLLALAPGAASADFSFNLDAFNVSGYTGPFASVSVHVTSDTTATVTFTGLNGYRFVDGGSLALNVAANITPSNPTINNGDTLTAPMTLPANVDGWGKFNVIYDQQSSNNPATVETVDLTGTGTTWLTGNTSISDQTILEANSNGALAAAHLLVPNSTTVTGFASGSGGTPPVNTPAPSSAILLGVGCLSMVFARKIAKFRKGQPVAV